MPTPEEIKAAEVAKKAADEAAAKQAEEVKNKGDNEHMIPKSRFDEVNDEKKKLADRLAQIEAEQKIETEKRLIEQQEYQKLAETRGKELADLQPKAAKVDAMEKTLVDVLTAQVAELPEDKRGLIPDELSTQQKLNWLAKNAAILKAPAAIDVGAGKHGAESGVDIKSLTPEELAIAKRAGISAEDYAKNK
jgi:ribonucleoside-triphosphate reductase